MDPYLRQLKYFVTLADVLHFRGAAEALHITQPALSHQIKALEKHLGSTLLARIGHKVQLTDAGRIFREHALRALKEMESATTAIAELGGLVRGNLGIGVFQSFNSYLLPPILIKFYETYPGIHITVRQLPKRDMENRILNGELDFGIAYAPAINEKIDTENLFEESCVLVVGKKHALHGRRTLKISALDAYPLILVTQEFPLRQFLNATFSSTMLKPRIALEMNSTDAILEIVSKSGLATILAARRPRSITGVHCIDLEPAITRTAAIFWRRDGHRSTASVEMAKQIKEAYASKKLHNPLSR